MPKIPGDANPETRSVIRALWDAIEKLNTTNIDLRKRRFLNAGKAVSRSDFLTKGEFDDALTTVLGKVGVVERAVRVSATAGGTAPGQDTNPTTLPPPNHPMDFGYYKVETVRYGNFLSEVSGFTNLVYVGSVDYGNVDPPIPASDRKAAMGAAIGRISAAGLKVMLDVERGNLLTIGDSLQAAQPYWDKVAYLILGDEINLSAAAMDQEVIALRQRLTNLGLPNRPIGATFTPPTTLTTDAIFSEQLDFINIEAYTGQPEGYGSSQATIAYVTDIMNRMRARIPASKSLTVVMQAYDRNHAFSPITPDLVDLQTATYNLVKDDIRVKAMVLFAWAFPGGSRDHTELQAPHRAMWAAINGQSTGATACGQGRPCCGGSDNAPNCPRWCSGGDYQDRVFSAVDAYVAGAPASVIDPADSNHVLDTLTYMQGVRDQVIADNPNLTARIDPGQDGKELQVKAQVGARFSEQYALWSGGGATARVRRFYAATCYPASF